MTTDFIATLTYKTTQQGGRKTPAMSGYRPHIKFDFEEMQTSGQQIFINRELVFPGETVDAEISIIGMDYFANKLKEGMEFEFREGARVIGTGKIKLIINDKLRKTNDLGDASALTENLNIFRQGFFGANTWAQRKDGVPLDLLDKLSVKELEIAENELILSANLGDNWPIIGLGYMKSLKALPMLYDLLEKSEKAIRLTIAHSIFEVCQDPKMIEIVLQELPKITSQYELIEVLYRLPTFQDEKITALLNNYRNDKEYLVSYNATRALGIPTDDVVVKFRKMNRWRNFWKNLIG